MMRFCNCHHSEYQQEERSSESEEEDSGNKNKQSELTPSNTLSAAADCSATRAPLYNRRFQVTKGPNSLTWWNLVQCNHKIQYFWA